MKNCGALINGETCQHLAMNDNYYCDDCNQPLCFKHALIRVVDYCNQLLCPNCYRTKNQLIIKLDNKFEWINQTGDELFAQATELVAADNDRMKNWSFHDRVIHGHLIYQDETNDLYLKACVQYYTQSNKEGEDKCVDKLRHLIGQYERWNTVDSLLLEGLSKRVDAYSAKLDYVLSKMENLS